MAIRHTRAGWVPGARRTGRGLILLGWLGALLAITAGCSGSRGASTPATTPEPLATVPEDGGAPSFPAWLALTPEQEPRAAAIVARIRALGEPITFAAEGVAGAVASSARRRCEADDLSFLELRLDRLATELELTKRPLIQAINDFHALLAPAQRQAVVAYLRDREEQRRARREERANRGSIGDAQRDMGIDLDLTFGQIATLIVRLRGIQSRYQDRTDPWLAHYRVAIDAFARADFDLATEPVAEVPVGAIVREVGRDAYVQLITVFDDAQCDAIARFIRRKVAERAEERSSAAAAADAESALSDADR